MERNRVVRVVTGILVVILLPVLIAVHIVPIDLPGAFWAGFAAGIVYLAITIWFWIANRRRVSSTGVITDADLLDLRTAAEHGDGMDEAESIRVIEEVQRLRDQHRRERGL